MSTKNILPEHDPAPAGEHLRYVNAENDTWMLVSYLPVGEYGYNRLILFGKDGHSIGYLDVGTEVSEHGTRAHLEPLVKLLDLYGQSADLRLGSHNERVRRYSKSILNPREIAELAQAKERVAKEGQAEKVKPLTWAEESAARALRIATVEGLYPEYNRLKDQVHAHRSQLTRAEAAAREVEQLEMYGGDPAMIAKHKETQKFFEEHSAKLSSVELDLQAAKDAISAAQAKSLRAYHEDIQNGS